MKIKNVLDCWSLIKHEKTIEGVKKISWRNFRQNKRGTW